jgi:phosphotransferase system enzyme I (PtsP)
MQPRLHPSFPLRQRQPLSSHRHMKWMLRQVELSMAKDLLAELMTIDNPQVIHSSLQLALKKLGLTRMINPASAKTL